MPSRKRHKRSEPVVAERTIPNTNDIDRDLARFADALKSAAAADRQRALDEQHATERARQLDEARVDLDAAIDAVRRARSGSGNRTEADDRWKRAKARVIELETGTPPAWQQADTDADPNPTADAADDEPAAESPSDPD
jgi:hypothetical protein